MKLRFIVMCIFSALLLASCGEKEDEPTGGNGHFGGNGGGSGKPSGGNTVTELLIGAWETYFDEGSKYVEFHENGDYFVELTGLEEAAINGQYYVDNGNMLYIMLDGEKDYTGYLILELTDTTLQLGYAGDLSGDMSIETYTRLTDEDDGDDENEPADARVSISAPVIGDVTERTIAVKGTILADDGITFDSRGVCYGIAPGPTPQDGCVEADADVVDVTIERLYVGTVYYIRLYAVVDGQTLYGEEISVKTAGEAVDKIELKQTVAECNAIYLSRKLPNGVEISGLCYGTSPHPEITDSYIEYDENNTLDGQMIGSLGSGLERGTVYYIRPYLIKGSEITYFDDSEITAETIGASVDIRCLADYKGKIITGAMAYWKFTDVIATVEYAGLPEGRMYECRLYNSLSEYVESYDEIIYVEGGTGNIVFPEMEWMAVGSTIRLTVTDMESGFVWRLIGNVHYVGGDDIDSFDFEMY